jgi:DnaJ-class molecular chaperone
MAARDDRRDDRDETTCRPCKGSGTVISGLGGEHRQVPCPWCGGTGVREPGRDAQEAAKAARAAAGDA